MKKSESQDNGQQSSAATKASTVSYKTAAVRTISFWYNKLEYSDTNSHIMTGLFLGMIPHDSPLGVLGFVNEVNSTRPLGLIVSVVEKNELDGEGYWFTKMVTPEEWRCKGVDHHLIEMEDFTAEVDIKASIETIKKMRACIMAGNAVFIHCKAGRARSAMFCAIYLCLYVNNPETGKRYTFEEAIERLKDAREQVKIGTEKQAMGKAIYEQCLRDVALLEVAQYNPHAPESPPTNFDDFLGSKPLKDALLKLPAVAKLIEYQATLSGQYKLNLYVTQIDLKKTPKRATYIDQICELLAKPHSEEWYFRLINKTGPFEALLSASPKGLRNMDEDKGVREKLIKDLQDQVRECIDAQLGPLMPVANLDL